MNIVLTGFMASGKTEISKAIAAASRYKLIDTDDMIVKETGKTINEIFAEVGEKGFRELEHRIICKAAALDGYVIATGGGVVLNKDNITALRKNGVIVNLAPDFSVIKARLEAARATRPLLQNQDIDAVEKRFNDRLPFYADCDFKIHIINGRTPRSYALEILNICENR
ncbi:MAG: shikimate kinase [Candidatus Ornithomonoglobus sp.]